MTTGPAQIAYGGFLGLLGSASDIDATINVDQSAGAQNISIEFHRSLLGAILPDPLNTEWDLYTLTEVSDPGNVGSAVLGNGTGDTDALQPDGTSLTNRNDWQHDTFKFTFDTSAQAWKDLAIGESLTVEYRVDAVEYGAIGGGTDELTIKLTFVKTCFTADSLILMADGTERRAGDINVGDMIATVDNGARPVRWVGKTVVAGAELEHFPSWKPVIIRAGALGGGLPASDLQVSQLHRVVVRGAVARQHFDSNEVLVAARFLTALDGVEIVEDASHVDYVHFMFDRHEIITANGVQSESFCVSPLSRNQVGAAQLVELEAFFPDLAAIVRTGRQDLVRPVARGPLAEKIIAGHRTQGIALQ
ncbi:Hint domain-containing protein [Paracoccus suum]|nr:Hint domain-containing protein [Paracoccus suum]